jgi:hypothetical protein
VSCIPFRTCALWLGGRSRTESYQITRSVPPEPMRVVSYPDPTDTLVLDQDVTPGKSYYYMVAALSENGGVGLKAGSAPVLPPVRVDGTITLKVGQTRGTGMFDNELHHMMIMDTTVVAMSPYNYYKAKAPGVTFIIKSLQQKDGAPYLWAERVTVLP